MIVIAIAIAALIWIRTINYCNLYENLVSQDDDNKYGDKNGKFLDCFALDYISNSNIGGFNINKDSMP